MGLLLGLSVTVTGDPPLTLQIGPDCLGIMRGGCSAEPGLYVCGDGNWFSMCWNCTPSFWPWVSPPPPRCGPHTPRLLIDPFGTPCVSYSICVCVRPNRCLVSRWPALSLGLRLCYGERFVASGPGLKDISTVCQTFISGFLRFGPIVALYCPSLYTVPNADRGRRGNVILPCWIW